MKHCLLSILLFFIATTLLNAQQNDSLIYVSSKDIHDGYMHKSKVNRIVGFSMLVAGPVMFVAGIGINMSAQPAIPIGGGQDGVDYNQKNGLWLSYVGIATTLIAIPVLITAGKNKKAAKLALKNEVLSMTNKALYKTSYPALALTLTL